MKNDYTKIDWREFAIAFRDVANNEAAKLAARWKKPGEYTQYVLSKRREEEKAMLDRVCKKLPGNCSSALVTYRELLRIDMVFYQRMNPSFQPDPSLTDVITVAIEIENDFRSSLSEMYKLCQLNVPLAVLITYPDNSEPMMIEKFAEICRSNDIHNQFASTHRKLLICGSMENASLPQWEFFLFEGNMFVGPKDLTDSIIQ